MEACCSRFTAAEGGARLAAAAATKNILTVEYASFIPVRLLYEKAYQIRGSLADGRKRSAYVTRASRVPVVGYELKILTDLTISQAAQYEDVSDWSAELESKEVVVCTPPVLKQLLEGNLLDMVNINVLVLDSSHMVYEDDNLKYIMYNYKQCDINHRPIILALTYPLFTSKKDIDTRKDIESDCKEIAVRDKRDSIRVEEEIGAYENHDDFDMYEKLEWRIEEMERDLCCQMDLAEDIDGGKRISASITKPRELIIEYSGRLSTEVLPEAYVDLEKYMRDTVTGAIEFINDHRHDPSEIYGEELYEEFMNIPDPTIDPKHILNQFLYILDQLDLSARSDRRRERIRRNKFRLSRWDAFEMPDRDFVKSFRLTKDLVRSLIDDVSPIIGRERRQDGLSVESKVLLALSFYATGSYQTLIGQSMFSAVSQPTVSRAIRQICDLHLNILCVDPSHPGSTHDSTVWGDHQLNEWIQGKYNEEPMYFLGDSGYPLRKTLMTPYLNASEGSPEAHYYNVHVSARNVVERCIGVLKARFRCLLVARKLHYSPVVAGQIVNACAVLHNLANRAHIMVPELSQEEEMEERNRQINYSVAEEGFRNELINNEGTQGRHRINIDLQQGRMAQQSLINRLWIELNSSNNMI